MRCVLSLLALSFLAGAAHAQAPPEPLVRKVKTSIAGGVEYLVKQQRADGSWETTNDDNKTDFSGGSTALAVLALLNCDAVLDDAKLDKQRLASIAKGLNNLRKLQPLTVYVRALQTMAFAEAKTKTDIPIIKANVEWLIKARVFRKGDFIGWDYNARPNAVATDASNSQYAMLALWYARQAGVETPREVWQSIHDYYRRTQTREGYWIYSPYYDSDELKKPSITMTIAGLCGLYISGIELNAGREKWRNGKADQCGIYPDDAAIARTLEWLNGNPAKKIPSHFTLELPQRTYYHLYGLERAGRLSGMRFFGEHDWYREGCEYLVKKQEPNGAWKTQGGWDRWPHVNTSFALLFLSKGRTPVVISKIVHGNWPRREDNTDWNNDRNDLRHLTEYVSKTNLFGTKKPVAWQTYDIMRALYARGDNPNIDDENAIVADMRQSPILYITGHKSPQFRIQGQETSLIKRYVENGGFILAEACCGDSDFDAGFKQWVKTTWDQELTYLESTHPIWTTVNSIQAGQPYKLMGLQVGCRTVMIYSPQDLSCFWESNRLDNAQAHLAFRLGANIIAYGTGRTPPQPRLTPIDIAGAVDKKEIKPNARGLFEVSQINYSADSKPAPKAMSILLEHVHKLHGLDVKLRTASVALRDPNSIRAAKFLYLHGKGELRVEKEHLDALRFNLENGGLLLADACCGNAEFDKSFRQFAQALFPKEKLVRLSTDPTTRDRLFSAELNGNVLSANDIKCRPKANGDMLKMEPHLEGIQINGRWVVLYSKYDIGCALERNTSSDCVGYDHESALRIAGAAVLYNAKP